MSNYEIEIVAGPTLELNAPGPQGPTGPAGARLLFESAGTYPDRQVPGELVVFIGETDPDSLDLMIPGDVWIDNGI